MKFLYQAKNAQGQMQKGEVKASSKDAALELLKKSDLTVLYLLSQSEIPVFARRLAFFERIKLKDLTVFSRQLAVMIEARVSLVQCLYALMEQTKKNSFAEIIFNIVSDVEAGLSLSKAMAKHPKVFSTLYVSMIETGETSGTLDKSLAYLADYLESQYNLQSKVKNALVYPAFILVAFIGVVILMMLFVFPRITALLTESDQKLPIITRVLISATEIFRAYWWLGAIALIVLGFSLWYYKRTPAGQRQWDYLKIKLPLFGPLLQKLYMARFAGNLSTLITGGVSIIRSLEIVSRIVSNKIYEEIILEASKRARVGESLAASLGNSKNIPEMVVQMIKVGEQTGKLDLTLNNVNRFYSREVEDRMASLSELIQPILIVGMGLMVGFLVLSILMPIYNMVTAF